MKELSKYKYYASACHHSHGCFLNSLGFENTDNIEEADVIIFGGGADIDPATYDEKPSCRTHPSKEREKIEKKDFRYAVQHGIRMIGICRGLQFLCAMGGGKLIQDVSGHGGSSHHMTTLDGLNIKVNSLHHQMINPYAIKNKHDYQILAWTTKRRSNRYLGAGEKSIYLPYDFKEVEACYFPKIKALGWQYHPEMMGKDYEPAITWTRNIFTKFFEGNL